jgi:hypothetical protein
LKKAALARAIATREGFSEVNDNQPIWVQKPQLMKPKVLAQFNVEFYKATIKNLFLKRGKICVLTDKGVEPSLI